MKNITKQELIAEIKSSIIEDIKYSEEIIDLKEVEIEEFERGYVQAMKDILYKLNTIAIG
jgi:hypothetical protein